MQDRQPLYYLTYGDAPSGVYFSQVLDVCTYLSGIHSNQRVRVIGLLSPRLYRSGKQKIKARYPDAIIWPAMPGMHRWKLNRWILSVLFLFLPKGRMMARGPLAALLALGLRKKGKVDEVIFDGRGAYAAEWTEYDVVPDPGLVAGIPAWEKAAILNADLRLGVSEELVTYWRERYGYSGDAHVVVPCTLNSNFKAPPLSEAAIAERRAKLGYQADDLVLVYAGSAAGWQSFGLLEGVLSHWMAENPKVKLLFLTRTELQDLPLYDQYPDRIQKAWLPHEEVPQTLAAADYGIMIREKTVTNQVASPTKFAEYLSSGLRVLISEGLGDYSEAVAKEGLGFVIGEAGIELPKLDVVALSEKVRLQDYALAHFGKQSFLKAYERILG